MNSFFKLVFLHSDEISFAAVATLQKPKRPKCKTSKKFREANFFFRTEIEETATLRKKRMRERERERKRKRGRGGRGEEKREREREES